jgi:hypothetical protein
MECPLRAIAAVTSSVDFHNQLVPSRHLRRKVGRLLAFEDAVDVAGRALVLVELISPIGDQAAAGNDEACV